MHLPRAVPEVPEAPGGSRGDSSNIEAAVPSWTGAGRHRSPRLGWAERGHIGPGLRGRIARLLHAGWRSLPSTWNINEEVLEDVQNAEKRECRSSSS